jgi:hypothetical protein
MKGDNVIEFAAHRGQAVPEEAATWSAHRNKEAEALLDKLRNKKRLEKGDQSALVGNLGLLIVQLDAKNRQLVAKSILRSNESEKRKRYIRFPNEVVGRSTRHAASGGAFARIIGQLINERVTRGLDRDQAKIETVRDALKGTSFQRRSRLKMPEGDDNAAAAYLVMQMQKVFDKLAQEADLDEHFKLVSTYPIYTDGPYYAWSNSLELRSDLEPNSLHKWDWFTDEDELEDWIPWWAPKCVIGHLYIPFHCRCLHLPEHAVDELKRACGGTVTLDNWMRDECFSVIAPLVGSEWIRPRGVYHRLPIWLVALPLPNRLIPCLYAAIHHPGGFHPKAQFPSYDAPTMPCFTDKIGEQIEDDAVYFCVDDDYDDYETFYVNASDAGIFVIGSGVDESVKHFNSKLLGVSMIDEIPHWLHDHPVQRLLKLTMDSDAAKLFALSARSFSRRRSDGNGETVFRPAFADSITLHTPPLRQDTIAAYLLRNLVDADGPTIFEALKDDAIAKSIATKEVIDGALSEFQDAFEKRYGK